MAGRDDKTAAARGASLFKVVIGAVRSRSRLHHDAGGAHLHGDACPPMALLHW